MTSEARKIRTWSVFLLFLLTFAGLYYRLFVLQVVRHDELLARGMSLHRLNQKIEPRRGNIYDCKGRPLAMSVSVKSAYAVPEEIESPARAARLLSRLIPLRRETIERRLGSRKKFVWLARKLDAAGVKEIQSLGLKGIGFREEVKRVYPHGDLLSHVLGFVDIDNRGLEGLELVEDRYLKGQAGWRASQRDRKGREILPLRNQDVPAVDGCNLKLTVDTAML